MSSLLSSSSASSPAPTVGAAYHSQATAAATATDASSSTLETVSRPSIESDEPGDCYNIVDSVCETVSQTSMADESHSETVDLLVACANPVPSCDIEDAQLTQHEHQDQQEQLQQLQQLQPHEAQAFGPVGAELEGKDDGEFHHAQQEHHQHPCGYEQDAADAAAAAQTTARLLQPTLGLGPAECQSAMIRHQLPPSPPHVHLGRDEVSLVTVENGRMERSNSCSQAEGCMAARLLAAASSSSKGATNGATSVSHDNIAASVCCTSVADHVDDGPRPFACLSNSSLANAQHTNAHLTNYSNEPSSPGTSRGQVPSSANNNSGSHKNSSAVFSVGQRKAPTAAAAAADASSAFLSSSFTSSSSRFFSSKLNTGSLWSLLSVGSSTSISAINEISASELSPDEEQQQHQQEQQQADRRTDTTNNKQQQLRDFTARSANFFSQFKPKSTQVQQQQHPTQATPMQLSSSTSFDHQKLTRHQQQQQQQQQMAGESYQHHLQLEARKSRYRFNIKYIGSAMLHKNFTLPMLEWIVRDIKRQTNRAAQGMNQRQFTIPIRDIIFEIHSNQLKATSCKDGHPIFVHPMHCVSKYAQIQHDSASFAYIIRDTKDSPSFCHLFQAKSANKVHEIFSAIREVTTRQQFAAILQLSNPQLAGHFGGGAGSSCNRLQKSASTEGHWKSLLGPSSGAALVEPTSATPATGSSASLTITPSIMAPPPPPPPPPPSTAALCGQEHPLANLTSALQRSQVQDMNGSSRGGGQQSTDSQLTMQFENSYQFEVMFIKRVKLQCRRVPSSFVDDALETLKTFEVPKTTQIKGGVTKRIISASVDERQEYDENCQTTTPQSDETAEADRRGSSVSLKSHHLHQERSSPTKMRSAAGGGGGGGESKSCNQSPAKSSASGGHMTNERAIQMHAEELQHQRRQQQQSMSLGKGLAEQTALPTIYSNDFSPYNTITSSDLNERIAAIPVVSSSVSLDHETRQKLARQVRETIMATAATIQKEVYASGDKLDSSTPASRSLDSLARTSPSSSVVGASEQQSLADGGHHPPAGEATTTTTTTQHTPAAGDADTQRRSPAGASLSAPAQQSTATSQQQQSAAATATAAVNSMANNFDLFRRASTRQVVKNRTMLLLIGKDELCAISIDKHQMLFSKSFNSIVHCLQGIKNKDHFGLICRDSGKINPQAESYAGFVFKCQSDKVVREIMGALKQVIYSSQHNYHGYNSPYNPLNSIQSSVQSQFNHAASKQQQQQQQQQQFKMLTQPDPHHHPVTTQSLVAPSSSRPVQSSAATPTPPPSGNVSASSPPASHQQQVSLAAKRGFVSPIELDQAQRQQQAATSGQQTRPAVPPTAPLLNCAGSGTTTTTSGKTTFPVSQPQQPKNPIKSMFCDDCPLYWYHRLCCDVESLPAEASKAIILRRIDSSLSEREQDEVFTKFSEYKIESIDEHNEIFMSILRQLSEGKQLRHNQTQSHLSALAKSAQLARKQSSDLIVRQPHFPGANSSSTVVSHHHTDQRSGSQDTTGGSSTGTASSLLRSASGSVGARGHQRSGSSGGSLASVLGQQPTNSATLADASSVAMDNLKRAKNSISLSIENMLKRRSSLRDENDLLEATADHQQLHRDQSCDTHHLPLSLGSFGRNSRSAQLNFAPASESEAHTSQAGNLKRSQSTSDYQQVGASSSSRIPAASWRDSLSRTLNTDDLTNPLVGFFKRRGSFARSETNEQQLIADVMDPHNNSNKSTDSKRASTESLSLAGHHHHHHHQSVPPLPPPESNHNHSPSRHQSSHNALSCQFGGQSSPSSLLSGSFWKKSIFDKIQKTSPTQQQQQSRTDGNDEPRPLPSTTTRASEPEQQQVATRRRNSDELRSLWRKAILEQITLLKMDKQNQKLLNNTGGMKSSSGSHKQNKPNNINRASSPLAASTPVDLQRSTVQQIKLNYRDVPYGPEAMAEWSQLLKQDPTRKVQFVEVARLVRLGVPKQCRGEVWMFLMNQYQLRHGVSFQLADSEFHGDANQTYRSLLSQLSTQQHEIFVDIGRTFPSHPYYSQYLSIGQLSLFNLLKAYSLLDREVGYCQGLSFVAGILLLHVDSEDEAFELMRHLMFNFGLRKQYLPSMDALHLQLYQMTRLLRDHEFEIFNHFDQCDISPSLYAAPWFLTLFASQFALGFAARLLDLIYLIGIEAIFRVSLTLLACHRAAILKCTSLELTMDCMRSQLVEIDDGNLVKIFDDALGLDLRNKLIEYEIEYSFYCAEDKARAASGLHSYNYNHSHHHHHQGPSMRQSANSSSSTINLDLAKRSKDQDYANKDKLPTEQEPATTTNSIGLTSEVADATATVIIQHLLANNHLRTLRFNYSY